MDIRKVLPNGNSDESIFVFSRPYFLAFLPWFAIGAALIILGLIFIFTITSIFPEIVTDNASFNIFVVMTSAYFLLLIPFLTVAFIDFYYDLHIVTDRRLIDIDQNSLFSREINELALEEVQDVTTRNSGILRTVFDFGDVVIETAGSSPKFEFNAVLHPREIASVILDLSDQAKRSIEGGQQRPIPTGEPKGVINGQVFTSLDPLVEMGVVIDPEKDTPSGKSHPATSPTPEPSTKPETADKSKEEPEPTQETKSNQENDLDIVIDDPSQPPKA